MKQIRFIMHGCKQIGENTWKDIYFSEIVEVSDRVHELLTDKSGNFMGAEVIEEAETNG